MKKFILFIIFAAFITYNDAVSANRYADRHKKRVEEQYKSDIKKRDTVLKELKAFLGKSSGEVSDGRIKLGVPVEENSITDIAETGDFHYSGVIPPRIYGYVTTDTLNMRSQESSKSEVVGRLKFRERVEIIFQSDLTEEFKKIKAPWLLVRRGNGDEGWVFGGFISDDVPAAMDSDTGKADWNMIVPASGKLSSRFGYRVDPVTKRRKTFHKGIDISASEGTPVYAAESGTVTDAGYKKNGYGNLVVIKHDSDLATYYGHLSKIIVDRGRNVKKGELIGKVGSTGKSTGPHLHFEIRKGDKALDPEDYIR